MKTIVASSEQSMLDIAVQEFDTIEAVFDLAAGNDIGITALPGRLTIPDGVTQNVEVLTELSKRGAGVSSSARGVIGGIGYNSIEGTFSIQ